MTIKRLKFDSLSYKTLFIVVFLLLIGIIGLLRLRQQPSSVTASWFDESYSYRKAITVDNTSGSDLTDFQVAFDIGTSALIAQDKMQTDCDDIRITDQNGKLLPHWIEEGNPGCNSPDGDTKVWVKAPSLPTSGATLFVYYGNASASNSQNGDHVFEFFDDFETYDPSIWASTGAYSTSNGKITITTGAVYTKNTVGNSPQNKIFEIKEKHTNGTASYAGVHIANATGIQSSNVGANAYVSVMTDAGAAYNHKAWGADGTAANYNIISNGTLYSQTLNTDYIIGFEFQGSSSIKYFTKNLAYNDLGTNSPTGTWNQPYYLWLGYFMGSNSGTNDIDDIEVDWVRVRTYASTQPSLSLSSVEETSPAPIAWWKLDEGVGSTAFDSIGSNNASFGLGDSTPSWQNSNMCISGNCLSFDGNNDYISVPSHNPISATAGTISLWVKFNNVTQDQIILISGEANADGESNEDKIYMMLRGSDSKIVAGWQTSAEPDIAVSNSAITPNTWYHLALRWSLADNAVRLLVNTAVQSTGDVLTGNNKNTWSNEIRIGKAMTNGANPNPLNGFIDEIKIYPYARNQSQVDLEYTNGLSNASSSDGTSAILGSSTGNSQSLSSGLVGYWTMDEGVGTTTLDKSGNNNLVTFGSGLSAPSWNTGKYGNGLNFDGVDDYMSADVLSQLADEFTASVWIYPTRLEPQAETYGNTIFATSSSYGLWLLHNNGAIRIYAFSSDAVNHYYQTTATPITLNKWFHIVVTAKRNGEGKIFVNGNFLESFTAENDIGLAGILGFGDLRLGRKLTHQGLLDEVRLYNRSLSSDEVKKLYEYAPGPVAHYTFDSGNNTTLNDISGNSNNGTWVGSSTERYTTGKYGKAGNFNGSNDYLDILDHNSLHIDTNFTLSMWVKPSPGATGHFISKRGPGSVFVGIRDSDIYIRDSTSQTANPTYTLNDNEWQYLTAVKSGTTVTIYKNGIKGNSVTNSNLGSVESTGNIQIGGESTGSKIQSLIDEVRIYNYARTQKQILEDMQGGGPALRQPVAHYKFDEGFGDTAQNSGNAGIGLTGTISTGSPPPNWSDNGKLNKAISFSGNASFINLSNSENLNFTDQVTITTWINPFSTAIGDRGIIISDSRQGFWQTGGTKIKGWIRDSTNSNYIFVESPSGSIAANNWYHIAQTYNKNSLKLYINGILVDETPYSGDMYPIHANWTVGNFTSTGSDSRCFNGLIDEVKIYNYALTEDEVKLDYNQGSSHVMGTTTQTIGATTTSLEYCIPGDTSHCLAPISEWKMDEGIGTTAYDTSGTNDASWSGSGSKWTFGKLGKAALFNGSNDSLNTTQNIKPTDITVSMWVHPTSWTHQTHTALITERVGSIDGLMFFALNQGNLNFDWGDGTNSYRWDTGYQPPINTWTHLTITRNSTGRYLYVNGKYQNYTNVAGGPIIATSNITIGSANGGYNFQGKIDQVRIYDYARSPAQIAYDYNKGAPIAHWKLDECQGSTAYDTSGSNLNGNINIGPSGTQTSLGTCQTTNTAWGNGKTGRLNSSINFDGTDDQITINESPPINLTANQPFSISYWVKLSRIVDTYQSPIMKSHFGSSYGHLIRNSNNSLLIYTDDDTNPELTISSFFTASDTQNWIQISQTYDGDKIYVYKNGKLTNTSASGISLTSNTQPLYIGMNGSSNYFLDGQIDDVRIYNYALTGEQVKTLYNNGSVSFQ